MQVGIDVTCMYTSFGGCGLSSFGGTYLSKTAKFPFRGMDYSPWSSKNLIRNRLKKFMQVGVNVTCMYIILVGVASSVSEISYLSKTAKFPFWGIDSIVIKKFNQSKSVQKIHASRDRCHVHVHQFWWVWPLQFRRYVLPFKNSQISLSGHGL